MSAVTVEQLASARADAAAAVRVSATGQVSVRMPRLGSVRHGSVEAALRGCPCQPCDQVRDGLLVDQAEFAGANRVVELVDEVNVDEVAVNEQAVDEVDAGDLGALPRVEVELPAGLSLEVPRDITPAAGAVARRVVRTHSADAEGAVELLQMLGLAADGSAVAGVA